MIFYIFCAFPKPYVFYHNFSGYATPQRKNLQSFSPVFCTLSTKPRGKVAADRSVRCTLPMAVIRCLPEMCPLCGTAAVGRTRRRPEKSPPWQKPPEGCPPSNGGGAGLMTHKVRTESGNRSWRGAGCGRPPRPRQADRAAECPLRYRHPPPRRPLPPRPPLCA